MKNYIILCKEKDSMVITMFSGMTHGMAVKKMSSLQKDGASGIQLRKQTIGASSVKVA